MRLAPSCLAILATLALLSLAAAPAQAAALDPPGAQEDGNSWLIAYVESLYEQVGGGEEDGNSWLFAFIESITQP